MTISETAASARAELLALPIQCLPEALNGQVQAEKKTSVLASPLVLL